MIRKAKVKDIPGIMELLKQVAEVHHNARPDLFKHGGYKYSPEELEELLNDDAHEIYVYEDEGQIKAHLFAVITEDRGDTVLTDKKTMYIDDICVDENNRGKHIASYMYDHALDLAREKGCYNVTLNVWNGNASAIEFYNSRGMKIQKYGMEVIL